MKWKDETPKEYYAKYEKVEVANGKGWFDVYRLPGDVYGICEPQHFQEVNMYLIVGSERALLLDTGMGICELRPLVKELYSGEVIAVNSHFHFDHIGNNHFFEPIFIWDDEDAMRVAKSGLPKEGVGAQLKEDMFVFGYPAGFDPEAYAISPYGVKTVEDGEIFDLGNRRVRVIHTPGHSNDSIMLYDETNQILFTGDSFYLGALYAHFDCDEFGHGDMKQYRESLERVIGLVPSVKQLYCSHNDFIVEPIKLREAANALNKILSGETGAEKKVEEGHTYLEGEKQLVEYGFEGFFIVCAVQ